MNSAPLYFSYLIQTECPFFAKVWSEKLEQLMIDLTWIDRLNQQIETDKSNRIAKDIESGRDPSNFYSSGEQKCSKDFNAESFPSYHDWPKKWQEEYQSAIAQSRMQKESHLAAADTYRFDNSTLYILEDSEEVWFSTPHFANGDICKMAPTANDKVEFDSAITAAYAFKNDYQEWDAKFGNAYKAANILSSADTVFTDSLVGTTQECDGCAAFAKIVKDDGNVALCANCVTN